MFGLGTSEIIVIVIVALVLINPKEMPRIVRKLGKVYATIMREINGVRKTYGQFENEVKYLTELDEKEDKEK
ncbi:MAG: twin-arginine translocase TatA/TatE family subunit [Spirochaetales bacterium]|nr:twin-arginine translocase TatA/TatE family subunit [Spirochaetales bacterium]